MLMWINSLECGGVSNLQQPTSPTWLRVRADATHTIRWLSCLGHVFDLKLTILFRRRTDDPLDLCVGS